MPYLIAQFYVGMIPDSFDKAAADVNGNGSVDISDALVLAQFYVGIIDKLACAPGAGATAEPTAKGSIHRHLYALRLYKSQKMAKLY